MDTQTTNNEMVQITKKQYEALIDDALMLSCLLMSGVDNWEWYSDAIEIYEQEKNKENASNGNK